MVSLNKGYASSSERKIGGKEKSLFLLDFKTEGFDFLDFAKSLKNQ